MATLLSEGFEAGALPAGWATSSPTAKPNTWAVGSTIGGTNGPTSAYAGSWVLATNPSGNHASDEESVVDVELPDLTQYESAVLSWAQWLTVVNTTTSGAQIHLSTDGGATWAGVATGLLSPGYSASAPDASAGVLLPTIGRWEGTGSSWVPVTCDLEAALGASPRDQVVLRFAFEARLNENTRAGWYLDAVTLTADPVDETPPEVAITSGDEATATPFEITGTASDDLTGVDLVEVRVAGGDWEPATGTNAWTYSAELEEGENSIEVRATDGADNVSDIVTQTVTLDSIAPTVTITSVAGLVPSADYLLEGTAEDATSGVVLVEVRVAGGDWVEVEGTATWSLGMQLEPGVTLLEARATDAFGNVSEPVSVEVLFVTPQIAPLAATLDWAPVDETHWLDDAEVLEVAVVSSLWTWRRAEDDDALPTPDADRQGWWGDALAGFSHGSRLWLLQRARASAETASRAREYAREALAWMVDEGLVSRVDVTAERTATHTIALTVDLYRAEDGRASMRFGDLWAALEETS